MTGVLVPVAGLVLAGWMTFRALRDVVRARARSRAALRAQRAADVAALEWDLDYGETVEQMVQRIERDGASR